jgi:CheY-like chemotaxis protein
MAGDGDPTELLRLADAVADKTATRMRDEWLRDIDLSLGTASEGILQKLQNVWKEEFSQLRDDLTAKGLLRTEPPSHGAQTAVRVLIVEDAPELRKAIDRTLRHAGMTVLQASSGAEAAAILEEDLEVDVVMTSGYDQAADKARELGAFGFLPKPFSLNSAILLVERAAEFRRLKLARTSQG